MEHILEVRNLEVTFTGDEGSRIGVGGVSFFADPGEVVCLVGESGCGKSATSLAVMGLLGRNGQATGGEVLFEGRDLLKLKRQELDAIRGDRLTMIFQDPLSSLNPVFTVGRQVEEVILAHTRLTRGEARARALEILKKAGLDKGPELLRRYPHELSGGMRQRVMIAMALACSPRLLIADEPTTALDVTIQAQIMGVLNGLRRELSMAMLLITHDMGLVAQMADRVLVMYAGQIVEQAPVLELFDHPAHPYTRALLRSVPVMGSQGETLSSIEGVVPERYDTIEGCRFAGRCPYRREECGRPQSERPFGGAGAAHLVRCQRAEEVRNDG